VASSGAFCFFLTALASGALDVLGGTEPFLENRIFIYDLFQPQPLNPFKMPLFSLAMDFVTAPKA
jgi:hypothetical protein